MALFYIFANLLNICLTKRAYCHIGFCSQLFSDILFWLKNLKLLNIILFDIISQIYKSSFLKFVCKRNPKPDQWTPIILPFIKFKLLNKKLGF